MYFSTLYMFIYSRWHFFQSFYDNFPDQSIYEHTFSLKILCFMYLCLDNLSDNQLYTLLILFIMFSWPIQCTSDDIYWIFASTHSWNIQCHYLFLYIIWQNEMVVYNYNHRIYITPINLTRWVKLKPWPGGLKSFLRPPVIASPVIEQSEPQPQSAVSWLAFGCLWRLPKGLHIDCESLWLYQSINQCCSPLRSQLQTARENQMLHVYIRRMG